MTQTNAAATQNSATMTLRPTTFCLSPTVEYEMNDAIINE